MTRTQLILNAVADYNKLNVLLSGQKLYKCSARVYTVKDENGCFSYILKSYNTIVAVAYTSSSYSDIYVFDYYSSTTNTTHVPRFKRWIREKEPYSEVNIIPLYYTKHYYTKKKYKELEQFDFADVIHFG